jgi:hypothetical protein
MTEQKILNKFEATAVMVRDGVRVVDDFLSKIREAMK